MRHDVIPPLSDCVQLSVEQYRAKLYDIIRAEKTAAAAAAATRAQRGKLDTAAGERRASSHELRQQEAIRDTRTGDTHHHQVSQSSQDYIFIFDVNLFGKDFESTEHLPLCLDPADCECSGWRSEEGAQRGEHAGPVRRGQPPRPPPRPRPRPPPAQAAPHLRGDAAVAEGERAGGADQRLLLPHHRALHQEQVLALPSSPQLSILAAIVQQF